MSKEILLVVDAVSHERGIEKDIIFYSLIGLLATSLIGSFFSFDIKNSLIGCKDIARIVLTFIILRAININQKTFENIIKIALIGFVLTLFLGYYQYLFDINDTLKIKSVGHVNHSSIFILQMFIVSTVILLFSFSKLKVNDKYFYILISITSMISVYITNSRATMFVMGSILLLILIYNFFVFKNKKIFFIFIGLLLFTIIIVALNNSTAARFEQGFHDTARYQLFYSSFRGWLDNNVLFGIGIGNSYLINPQTYIPNSTLTVIAHPHNTYLSYLLERGAFGLLFYLMAMFSIVYKLIKQLKNNKTNIYIISAISLWIINFVISFANTTFHHENAQFMVIIWALALNENEKPTIHTS